MKRNHAILPALKHVLKDHPMVSVILIFSIILSVVVSLIPPLLLETIVNDLTNGENAILIPSLLWLGITILSCFSDTLKEGMITMFGEAVTHSLRTVLLDKMHHLDADHFISTDSGETVSLFVNDVDTVESLFDDGVVSMFSDLASIIGILIVIFAKSKGLFVILLIALPLIFALTRIFQKRMLKAQKENRTAVGRSSARIPETIHNIRSVRVFHAQRYLERKYDESIEEGYHAMNQSALYDALYSPIVVSVSSFIIAIMMVLCAQETGMRSWFGVSVGTAVALISYVGKVFDPLESLGMEIQNIQEAAAGLSRLNDFMNLPEKKEFSDDGQITSDPAISIDHVTFGYDPDKPVLRDFSMIVRKGETVTLAGRTGAGKSTVFRLLTGLYQPDHGTIRINGRKAGSFTEKEKRKIFGCVEQRFEIIPGTIRDQITLHDPEVSEDMVIHALKETGMYEAVSSLPEGMDTICEDSLFSQGQFQLLSIARAIVTEPQILLLDEITANLDSATERQIMDALQKAARDRTVLSISHRLYENTGGRIITIS